MALRNNISSSSRDFYFSPSGDDTLSGLGIENSVSSPSTAIDLVNALSIPPSSSTPASINSAEAGTYFNIELDIPEFTTGNCESAAIINTLDNQTIVTNGDQQTVRVGNIIVTGDNSKIYEINGNQRVRNVATSLVLGSDTENTTGSTGNVGATIEGSCDDVFLEAEQVEIRGDAAEFIQITGESDTPFQINYKTVESFNEDQVFLRVNSSDPLQEVNVTVDNIQPSGTATQSTTNFRSFVIDSGVVLFRGQSSYNDIDVGANGRFAMDVHVHVGDITIESGGSANIKNVGLWVGDITVEDGARLDCDIITHVGALNILGEVNGNISGSDYGTYVDGTEHFVSWHRRGNIPSDWTTMGTFIIDALTYKLDDFLGSFEKTTAFSRTVNFRLIDADTSDVYYEGDVTTTATGLIAVATTVDKAFPALGEVRLLAQVDRNGVGFGIQNAAAQLQFSER